METKPTEEQILEDAAYNRYLQGDSKWAETEHVTTNLGNLTVPKQYTREEFEAKLESDPEFAKLHAVKKQTAAKFLEQEFRKLINWQTFSMQYKGIQQDIKQVPYYTTSDFLTALEKAKEMEADEIKNAFTHGLVEAYMYKDSKLTAEDYYNQTYK